jgi:hypothetical protein
MGPNGALPPKLLSHEVMDSSSSSSSSFSLESRTFMPQRERNFHPSCGLHFLYSPRISQASSPFLTPNTITRLSFLSYSFSCRTVQTVNMKVNNAVLIASAATAVMAAPVDESIARPGRQGERERHCSSGHGHRQTPEHRRQ